MGYDSSCLLNLPMLTEESKRKLGFIALIVAAVIGALFVLFAVVLNRGTITFIADAPFSFEIRNLREVDCPESPCSTVVAPGEYIVTLKKSGYKDFDNNIEVPIFGEFKKEIKFSYVPGIKEVTGNDIAGKFAAPSVKDTSLKGIKVFTDESGENLFYLDINKETGRQALFSEPNTVDGNLQKSAITAFIRPITDYMIYAELKTQKQIALVDRDNLQSTLYLIDLNSKSRDNLLSHPLISGLKWLPGSKNFLFSARPEGQVDESIFLYDASQKKETMLDLRTPLKNILPLSSDRFIVITAQTITGLASADQAQGQLVTLGENIATPEVGSDGTVAQQVTSFIDYSLTGKQSRLILASTEISLPQGVILNETGNGIYFLVDGKVYELQFEE